MPDPERIYLEPACCREGSYIEWREDPTEFEKCSDTCVATEYVRADLAAPQWQPIETAPKDGTGIVAWWNNMAVLAWWSNRQQKWIAPSMASYPKFTHWMPLPAPPEEGKP